VRCPVAATWALLMSRQHMQWYISESGSQKPSITDTEPFKENYMFVGSFGISFHIIFLNS
jgi:hypothetical protein